MPYVAAVGLGLQVGSFIGSQRASRRQADMQRQIADEQRAANERQLAFARQQYEEQKRRADIQNVRAVRQQIRQARIAAGSLLGRAATSGTIGSSGVAGGMSSIGSQMAGNLSYMSDIAGSQEREAANAMAYQGTVNQSNQRLSIFSEQAGMAAGDYQRAQAFGALGSTIFTQAGGIAAFGGEAPKNMFQPSS